MAGAAKILKGLVRRWWLVGVLVVVGALAGLGYARWTPLTYTSNAYVVVVAQNEGDNTSAVSYAQAYARIAEQGDVLDAAVAASHGTVSVSELRRQVRASSSPDTPIIEISGSAGSASRAANLTNLVAGGLIKAANRHGTDTRMTLTLLSGAAPPADPTSPQLTVDVAVGVAMGLLLGGLSVLAGAGRTGDRSRPAEPSGPFEPSRPAELTSAAEPVHPAELPSAAEPMHPAEPIHPADQTIGPAKAVHTDGDYGSPPTIGLPTARSGPATSDDGARAGWLRPPS